MAADRQVDTQQQHGIKDHLHMGHNTLFHGKNITEKTIEKRRVVYEMHAGADQNQQYDGQDAFFA